MRCLKGYFMETTASTPPCTRGAAAGATWWLLLAVWSPLLWRLSQMWRSETEQMFGFGVPVLVAWLLWQRRSEWLLPKTAAHGATGVAFAGAGGLGLAVLVLEANPLWPTAAWLAVVSAITLTLGTIARGHGWRGARASAPVWLLMLTALKWPALVYVPVMQTMMQINAGIAAELVNLAGTPAVVQGNVIEVAAGRVGVDEACSGLRSLQTVIMMALFLGELERLRLTRRLALVAGAILAALLVNIARTTALTWMFANRGPDVEARWHDPVGVTALVVTLALVWLWAERLLRTESVRVSVPAESRWYAPAGIPLMQALIGVVLAEAGTQAWYRAHEYGISEQRLVWSLEPPAGSGWVGVAVPPRTAEVLDYESADSFAHELDSPSRQLLTFAFRWSGDLAKIGMPEAHNPLVCLPSVGAVQEAELPGALVRVDGVDVPFRFVRFRQGAKLQHVWFCLWGTRSGRADGVRLPSEDITRLRLGRVRAGLRNDEREQLIFFVQGEADDASAAKTLRDAVLTLMNRR